MSDKQSAPEVPLKQVEQTRNRYNRIALYAGIVFMVGWAGTNLYDVIEDGVNFLGVIIIMGPLVIAYSFWRRLAEYRDK